MAPRRGCHSTLSGTRSGLNASTKPLGASLRSSVAGLVDAEVALDVVRLGVPCGGDKLSLVVLRSGS